MPKKTDPKFERVSSGFKGVKAFKPNTAMQEEIVKSMPDELLNMPGMEKWKELRERSKS